MEADEIELVDAKKTDRRESICQGILIPNDTLEQIAAANDIVDIIGSHFPLKRAGAVYKALCPFHQEKTPSFTVNPQRQIFKCFGCGAGGGVFKFVELYENLNFPEAVKRLADRAGIKITEEELSADDDRRHRMRRRLLALHAEAADWFHRNLMKDPAAKPARDYLKKRGLTSEVAAAWRIGYAPDSWDAFGNWGLGEGYSVEELIASGLVKQNDNEDATEAESHFYDRFRDRVMFAICNDLGEVIAFSGRVLKDDPHAAKYVNSPETMLFIKGNVLFGLHKSKRALIDSNRAVVCEGQIDLITAFESGVQNVIAPQGTAFTEKQARILKRYVEEVMLCFDSDKAGQQAAERSLTALLGCDLNVRVVEMPIGSDPDSFIREFGAEAFRERIEGARDFFRFQIERHAQSEDAATPQGKTQFVKKMAGFVQLISDAVLRDSVVNDLCARVGVSANQFRQILTTEKRRAGRGDDPEPMREEIKLDPAMRWLCLAVLRDSAAREWLLAQDWREAATDAPPIFSKILEANLRPDDQQSVSAFMTRLETDEESLIASLLLEKMPVNPLALAQDCWNERKRVKIKQRQEVLSSKLRGEKLSMEEWKILQKEIVDLDECLTDIARPFPSRSQ